MTPSNTQEAIIYCRVSHPSQVARGNGLEGQEQTCRSYADKAGYKIIDVFKEPGISGEITDRPMMRELLDFLDKRPRSKDPIIVIIDDIKRLARKIEGHWILRNTIYSRNARLESPTHRFDNTPSGRLIETILAATAQHDRETNAEQVLRRMKARLELGYWCLPCNIPGLAYAQDKVHRKILRRHEPEATIVTEALEGFAEGRFLTQTDLFNFLIDKKLYGGKTMYLTYVKRLLERSIIYAGFIEYLPWDVAARPGHHDALISLATHEKIQKRLKEGNRNYNRKDLNKDFPHRGFVACPNCNTILTASWCKGRKEKYPKYWCRNRACTLFGKTGTRKDLEDRFAQLLITIEPLPNTIEAAKAMILKKWTHRMKDVEGRAKEIKREIASIEPRVSDYLKRAVETTNPQAAKAYEAEVEKLQLHRQSLEQQLQNLRPDNFDVRTALDEVVDFLKHPYTKWQTGDLPDRHLILKMVFIPPITYDRIEGVRTANFSRTFATLSGNCIPQVTGSGHGEN